MITAYTDAQTKFLIMAILITQSKNTSDDRSFQNGSSRKKSDEEETSFANQVMERHKESCRSGGQLESKRKRLQELVFLLIESTAGHRLEEHVSLHKRSQGW